MANKGYAASTLSDIAAEADMSSSHLLYYYSGKEAILADLFDSVGKRLKQDLASLPPEPDARLDAIADLILGTKRADRSEQAVMLDLYGQTVQNKGMRRAKAAQDRIIRSELVKIFKQTPRTPGNSPEDAAHATYAMLMGLRTNAFYDTSLTTAQTHRLFRQALSRLVGVKPRKTRTKPRTAPRNTNGRSSSRSSNRAARTHA